MVITDFMAMIYARTCIGSIIYEICDSKLCQIDIPQTDVIIRNHLCVTWIDIYNGSKIPHCRG